MNCLRWLQGWLDWLLEVEPTPPDCIKLSYVGGVRAAHTTYRLEAGVLSVLHSDDPVAQLHSVDDSEVLALLTKARLIDYTCAGKPYLVLDLCRRGRRCRLVCKEPIEGLPADLRAVLDAMQALVAPYPFK
jgi:hypothetical protein